MSIGWGEKKRSMGSGNAFPSTSAIHSPKNANHSKPLAIPDVLCYDILVMTEHIGKDENNGNKVKRFGRTLHTN
jgi:hypothetical protein